MAAGCFRAFLAMRLDYVQATQIAAGVGQVDRHSCSGSSGSDTMSFLIFIALFVWLAGTQEAGLVQIRSSLGNIPVLRAMITDFRTLHPDDPLERAVGYVLAGFQQDFPVVENGQLVGILTRNDLATALGRHGPTSRVGDVMQQDFATTDPHEILQSPFPGLRKATLAPCPSCRTAAWWDY